MKLKRLKKYFLEIMKIFMTSPRKLFQQVLKDLFNHILNNFQENLENFFKFVLDILQGKFNIFPGNPLKFLWNVLEIF